MTSIQPELWVDRGVAALAFYESAFGARVLHRVGEGDDIVAQLAVGDAAFWIAATGSSTERLVRRACGVPKPSAELSFDGSGCSVVFVDEAAEDRSPNDGHGFVGVAGLIGSWWAELLTAVGLLRVVVQDILGECSSEVALAKDQHSIGEFCSARSDEPLGEAVRLRAARRNLHHGDASCGQDRVEGVRELAGPVPDEEPELVGSITEVGHQIPVSISITKNT